MISEGKYEEYRKKYHLEMPFTQKTYGPDDYRDKERDFDLITMAAITSGSNKVKEEYINNILPYAPNEDGVIPNVVRNILRDENENPYEEISELNESDTTQVESVLSDEKSINIFSLVTDTSEYDYGSSDGYSI